MLRVWVGDVKTAAPALGVQFEGRNAAGQGAGRGCGQVATPAGVGGGGPASAARL